MSSPFNINDILNINVSQNSVPVPHTDGGASGSTSLLAPNTGFDMNNPGDVFSALGVPGCALIITTLVVLVLAIVVFCLRHKMANRRVASFASLGLLAFAFGLCVPSVIMTSHALELLNDNHTTNVSVTGSSEGAVAEQSVQYTFTSTAPHGYYIYAYIEGDGALRDADGLSQINAVSQPVAEPADLPMNSYGVRNVNTGQYGALSTDPNNPTPIFYTIDPVAAGTQIDISYATKVDDTLLSGDYNGKIVYVFEEQDRELTDLTTMQEMTPEICAATHTPSAIATTPINIHTKDPNYVPTVTLTDARDGKTYQVAKLADGNCWMIDNLRLGTTDTASSIALSPADTNISSDFALPGRSLGQNWGAATAEALVYPGDQTDSNNRYYGYGYNYHALSAGTAIGTTTEAASNICPKGWTVPNNHTVSLEHSYTNLLAIYGVIPSVTDVETYAAGGYDKLTQFPLQFNLSGEHGSGADHMDRGNVGIYWTATSNNNTTANALFIKPDAIKSGTSSPNKGGGYVIRCLSK